MTISESQKGRVIEQLIGATLVLQSDGELRVSLPFVDDEGVDLIVGNRKNDKSLLLQIKGRFSLSGRGHYRANVRRATCASNPSKYLLFIYFDTDSASLGKTCWLICATDFCKLLSKQKDSRPVFVFDSTFDAKADMWKPFRCELKNVSAVVLSKLQ